MSKTLRMCFYLLPIAVVILGVVLVSVPSRAPAQGDPTTVVQPPMRAAIANNPGRYLISSSGAGQMAPNGKMDFVCAAYVIDSQTGDVYFMVKDEEPKLIGSVAKKK